MRQGKTRFFDHSIRRQWGIQMLEVSGMTERKWARECLRMTYFRNLSTINTPNILAYIRQADNSSKQGQRFGICAKYR